MDNYFEQSVAGNRGPRERLAYGISWAAVVMLALAAIFFAANIVLLTQQGGGINWLSLVFTLVCAALAVLMYRAKDSVYKEYDYILWNNELEISAVYNGRRRKKVATIPLGKVSAWGPLEAMDQKYRSVRKRFWCIRPGAAWSFIYPAANGSEAALLELSDEMVVQIRALGRSMRDAEVKP